MRCLLLVLFALGCRNGEIKGGPDTAQPSDDADGDGFAAADDCDDSDAQIYPGAVERCNDIDDDCNGVVDDALDGIWYTDADGDGYGDDDTATETCDPTAGQTEQAGDCDDSNSGISPAGEEVCDGLDNDCDADIDEEVLTTFYTDGDGDGYGDPDAPVEACTRPAGTADSPDDCDDTSADIRPDADELCDGEDNDCDGETDEADAADAETFYADIDGDSYGDTTNTTRACAAPPGYTDNDEDCDDTSTDIQPDATELCDGVDNDCDGDTDEADASDATTWYADADGDTYGDASSTTLACSAPSGYTDNDEDCDDTNPAISPGKPEVCDGSTDEDCDGDIDEADATDAITWYADADGDGYGSSLSGSETACTAPSGYVSSSADCDDTDAAISPAATEICDGVDNDCDGSTDDSSAADAATWFIDDDGDGYGDPGTSQTACSEPSGYCDNDTDCDDTDAAVYPGSSSIETPFDGIDQDCDGIDYCTDLDCDGQPDVVMASHYNGSYTATSYVYFNDGGFADADRTALVSYGAYDVDAEDLDGDGYQDIVIANYSNDTTRQIDSYIYWGSASGYSSASRTDLPTMGTVDVLIEDLDEDGYQDLVFVTYYTDLGYSGRSYVYYGSASGYSTTNRTDLATEGGWQALAEDFDGDGYKDLAFCNYYNGSHAIDSVVYWGGAAGYNRANRTDLPTRGCRDLAAADLDGDGYSDLVFANYYASGTYLTNSTVYYGSAAGFSTSSTLELPTFGTLSVALGDYDGDGTTDVAFGGYYGGSWSASAPTRVYWNSAAGLSSSDYTDLGTRGIREVLAADIDSDGFDDLVGAQYYTGSSHYGSSPVWYGSSAGLSDSDRVDLPTVGTGHLAVGDLSGDGYPELVFSNYYTGSWSSFADDYIYWSDASDPDVYDSTDVTGMETQGTWSSAALVGAVGW